MTFTTENAATWGQKGGQKGGVTRAAQPSMQDARRAGGQARAALPGFRHHQARNFAITAARYGDDFARRKAAAKRKAHPPCAQAQVGAWLRALGYVEDVDYWHEVQIWVDGHDYYADYKLLAAHGAQLLVEIDGPFHDPARDAARDASLRALGYATVRLPVPLVERAPDTARQLLFSAIVRAVADADEATAVDWDPAEVAA